jgi:hypothetical protein
VLHAGLKAGEGFDLTFKCRSFILDAILKILADMRFKYAEFIVYLDREF